MTRRPREVECGWCRLLASHYRGFRAASSGAHRTVLLDKLIVILQPICLPAIEVLPSSQKLTNLDL